MFGQVKAENVENLFFSYRERKKNRSVENGRICRSTNEHRPILFGSDQERNRNRIVAQLVERSLLTPEIRGSNPDIGNIRSTNSTINRKDGNKEKEAGNGPS